MEADTSSCDAAATSAPLKPTNAKPILNNPYLRNPLNLGYYTPYPSHVDTARLQAIARGSQNTFHNPYLSRTILSTKPSALVRSVSDTQAKLTTNRPAATGPSSVTNHIRVPTPATTVFSVKSNEATPPAPKLRSKSLKQAVSASAPRASTPQPENARVADNVMIPKHVALKMNFDDFKPEEFLDRGEWSDLARYPINLDPPNGLMTLRCLFCEKKYSGPNARSMWRRHVGGKHNFVLNGGKAMPSKPSKPTETVITFAQSSKKRDRKRPNKRVEMKAATTNSQSTEMIVDQDSSANNSFETIDAANSDQSDDELEEAINEISDNEVVQNELTSLEPPLALGMVSESLDALNEDTLQGLRDMPQIAPATPFGHPSCMRRSISTPSFLPSRDIEPFDPLGHPFLLPPFEEGTPQKGIGMDSNFTSPLRLEWPSDPTFADNTNIPTTESAEPEDVAERIAQRGLKATSSCRDLGLLPSITLAPSLRSPKCAKRLRSPPTPSGSENRWLSSNSPSTNSSNRPSTPRSHQRNASEASPTSLLQRLTSGRTGVSNEGSISTPVPVQPHKLSESDRRRWLLALESPGPGPPFPSSSPGAPSSAQSNRLLPLTLGQSPQHPTLGRSSARKAASFLHPFSTGVASENSYDAMSSFQYNEETASAETGKIGTPFVTRSTPRRYTLPSSIYGSSPMGPPSTTRSRFMHSRTPSLAHSHTRSSSIEELGHDDPFASELTFPYDPHSRLRDRLRDGKKETPTMLSGSPFLKRSRESEATEEPSVVTAPPSLDVSGLEWMDLQDSSPVKKKARLSQ
ncbi:uncharacterized protein EI90DRAFT_3151917 [Cantharellus anzutake]|uniref:uncharacterized protein n=1 Tax=Cantharellus anzutake TaxID=1750568 RepID=UPI0019086B28|nr:uncharacterized protein EI90DRAFT_3151917 [Cantharellus anzutake]KAF8338129.1 hypothetical protein EI90DRAFT_3151917 [Cantharellus anzutake]